MYQAEVPNSESKGDSIRCRELREGGGKPSVRGIWKPREESFKRKGLVNCVEVAERSRRKI